MRRFFFIPLLFGCCLATAQDEVKGRLPAYLISQPESAGNVFVADTGAATLYRFTSTGELLDERYMSIGEKGVGKAKAWDRRTPLGIYFVTEQLDTSKLHSRYGLTAYPLDYPNAWDSRLGRTGDGIWLHGVDPNGGERPPLDTDGCIALPNEELLALEDDLNPQRTAIIVTRSMSWATASEIETLRNQLVGLVQEWAESQQRGDQHRYLAFYAPDFSYRSLTAAEWSALKVHTLSAQPIDSYELDNLAIFADPEEQELYLSRFSQTISFAGRAPVTTVKRLYWRRDSSGEFRIVAEDNG